MLFSHHFVEGQGQLVRRGDLDGQDMCEKVQEVSRPQCARPTEGFGLWRWAWVSSPPKPWDSWLGMSIYG